MKWDDYECDGQINMFDFVKDESRKVDDILEREILRGSGFQNGKKRIYDFFMKHTNEKERAEFLKKEYGIGGHTIPEGHVEHNSSGIDIKFNERIGKTIELHSGWPMVARHISNLIVAGKYYIPNYCKYAERSCNHENLVAIAEDLGFKCRVKCCRLCPESLCGARCGASEVKKLKPLHDEIYCQYSDKYYCNRWGCDDFDKAKSDLIKGFACSGCCRNCSQAPQNNGKCKHDCRVRKG